MTKKYLYEDYTFKYMTINANQTFHSFFRKINNNRMNKQILNIIEERRKLNFQHQLIKNNYDICDQQRSGPNAGASLE